MEVPDDLAGSIACGWLIVPEHHDRPDARPLRLAYAVVRAVAPDPKPDPVLFLQGGPGFGFLSSVPTLMGNPLWAELRQQRDIVFVDFRGTGYSEPLLCSGIDDVWKEHDYVLEPDIPFDDYLVRAAEECRDAVAGGGYDPAAYNSPAVARDLDALRTLLGYEQWNLHGVSYGGRYAQTLMRQRPEAIRSSVLAAPNSLGFPQPRTQALSAALDAVFAQCRAVAACDAAYPDLEGQFEQLLTRLEAAPSSIEVSSEAGMPNDRFVVNRHLLLQHIHLGLYQEGLSRVLPLLISEAAAGRDHALLAFLWDERTRLRVKDESRPKALAHDLALATLCYDESGTTPEFVADMHSQYPLLTRNGWYDDRLYPLCGHFHQARATEVERTAPNTGISTLVLGGAIDPAVSLASVRHAANAERGATLAIAPALGHRLWNESPCIARLIAEFVETPTAPLDTACLAEHEVIPFVTDVHRVRGMGRFSSTMIFAYPGVETSGERMALSIWGIGSVFALLSALLIWTALWLWRRIRGTLPSRSRAERRSLWLAVATCVVGVGFFILLNIAGDQTLGVSYRILAVGVLGEFGWVFLLPWLLAALALALVIATVIAWRRGYWGRWMRVHYTLVALAAVASVAFIGYWPLV